MHISLVIAAVLLGFTLGLEIIVIVRESKIVKEQMSLLQDLLDKTQAQNHYIYLLRAKIDDLQRRTTKIEQEEQKMRDDGR